MSATATCAIAKEDQDGFWILIFGFPNLDLDLGFQISFFISDIHSTIVLPYELNQADNLQGQTLQPHVGIIGS